MRYIGEKDLCFLVAMMCLVLKDYLKIEMKVELELRSPWPVCQELRTSEQSRFLRLSDKHYQDLVVERLRRFEIVSPRELHCQVLIGSHELARFLSLVLLLNLDHIHTFHSCIVWSSYSRRYRPIFWLISRSNHRSKNRFVCSSPEKFLAAIDVRHFWENNVS